MPSTTERSIEDLREESEQTREDLAATFGMLRDKFSDTTTEIRTLVSPSHIKQEIKDYIREEREGLVETLQRKAKENPLQMAAIGAAIAYPALGLLRAIPTPLMLIGAGLLLTSKRGQESAKDIKSRVDVAVREGAEKVSDLVSSVKSDAEDRIAGARYGIEEAQHAVTSAVSSAADKARTRLNDVTSAVTAAVGDAAGKAASTAQTVAGKTAETAATFKAQATETVKHQSAQVTKSRDAVIDFVNDNPLLVAGIGAAVGAIIAASIPPSDAENRLFGAGSAKLKSKAREAAAQGIEKAGDIAADAAGSVAAAAAREGIDAAGITDTLNTVAEKVRAVADRGIDSALGNKATPTPQPIDERNPT